MINPAWAHLNWQVGDLRAHTQTLDASISAILTGLASGKYSDEVKLTEEVLLTIGEALPPVAMLEKALEFFLFVNKLTAPRGPVVPDGMGGWVPESNSRYDPKTGRFL